MYMKSIFFAGLVLVVLAVFIVSVSAGCGCAEGNPGNPEDEGGLSLAEIDVENESGDIDPIVISPGPVLSSISNRVVRRISSGNKSIQITNPMGNISISIVTQNATKTIEIEKDFENVQSIKTIIITPGRAEVEMEVETENRTLKKNVSANWTPVIRARIRQRIRNMTCEVNCPLLNISYNNSLKKAVIISRNLTAVINGTVEIDNETVYIRTRKHVRKELRVLPENASETARLRVNYHLVKAVEIESRDDEVYYAVKGTQLGKILWIFPVEMDVQTHIDIDSGEVKRINKPWWSFFVF
jgi:hypothetical protein